MAPPTPTTTPMTVFRVCGLSPEELDELFWFTAPAVLLVLTEVDVPVEVNENVRLPEVVTTTVVNCCVKLLTDGEGAVVVSAAWVD